MGLLPPIYISALQKAANTGSVIVAHPFKWNKAENCAEYCHKRRRLWHLNFLIVGAYTVFLTLNLILLIRKKEKEVVDLIFLAVIMLIYWFAVLLQTVYLIKGKLIIAFLQAYPSYMEKQDGRYHYCFQKLEIIAIMCSI